MGMFGRSLSRPAYTGNGSGVLDPSLTHSFASKLGLAGDILTGNPVTQNRLQQQSLDALKVQQAMAGADPKEPDVIRSLRAAGIDPASARGQAIISSNYSHPIVLGSPETQQTVVGGGFGMPSQAAGPPAEAVMRLKQNPHETAQFDEIFGAGAAARALGQQ